MRRETEQDAFNLNSGSRFALVESRTSDRVLCQTVDQASVTSCLLYLHIFTPDKYLVRVMFKARLFVAAHSELFAVKICFLFLRKSSI